ncbi:MULTISPECIES: hypothetical protein [Marinobacter]|uniref:Uncharacterized protein n=1 Tax=Marinobacter metalliresistant TaxID=2961995 RepID=A0ABZ2W2N1_9GAMM|nr:hypothetical protein [Marinobacter sp. Arc7-DN-1]
MPNGRWWWVGYLVVTHPGIISDFLAEVPEVLGYSVWLVQFLGWLVILLPVLYIGSWVMRLIVRPTIAVLSGLVAGLSRLNRRKSLNRIDWQAGTRHH